MIQLDHRMTDASEAERGALACIRYDKVEGLMHRDARLAPSQRASWSPVNDMLLDQHNRPMFTIWVNALLPGHDVAAGPVFQALNPQVEVDEALVMQRTTLERPIVDGNTAAHVDRLLELHAEPGRRVFFCGSCAARVQRVASPCWRAPPRRPRPWRVGSGCRACDALVMGA
jgi:uncharacterized protein